MQKKLNAKYLREDEAIKSEIIARVVEDTAKEALKDGALFAELQKKSTHDLLAQYGAGDNKNVLKKTKSHAFGKDVYLLGADDEGTFYWLEAAKWDCGWYWGFGYVETYTRNAEPSLSRDINSHTHIDSSFLGTLYIEKYNSERKDWDSKKVHVSNIYETPKLAYTTFSEDEGWKLSELFNSYYLLKDAAAFFGRGGSHTMSNPVEEVLKDEATAKRINEKMIPAITSEVVKILTA